MSDGSFNPTLQRASSSFIIALAENSNIDILLSGSNFVPGLPEDQSAYRSELAGILGVLYSVEILVTHFHTTSGSITIALDGESALDEARGDWPLQIHQPHFDLLQVIRVLVKRLPITVKWKWVRGHQREKGHGTAGTCALQKHAALDARISIDFQLGPTGMLPNCRRAKNMPMLGALHPLLSCQRLLSFTDGSNHNRFHASSPLSPESFPFSLLA